MPKKPPRNAFYYFMINFKEEERKKGINYANLAEVADAAGPAWRNAPPSVRSKFEAIAKQEKQKRNIPDTKFTSHGISLAEIEQQEKELRDAEEAERQDIKNFVKLKSFNDSIKYEDIYLMDVNFYCKTSTEYVIGESSILRFNLQDGIKDIYHELINPPHIPIGYASDIKIGSQEYGLEMPDDTQSRSNFMQILANCVDYLKQQDPNVKSLPPIFTMPDKVAPVQDFILQMCNRAAEDDSIFRIYKLDTLFFTLINAIKTCTNEGFPKESLALAQLKKDSFKYTPGIGCEHHEIADKSIECTTSRTKRWAYTILDSCCPVIGIDLQPGKHMPADYDIESIHTYKEQKKVRAGPSVAKTSATTSYESSLSTNQVFNTAGVSSLETPAKEKRTHRPLRLPKTDYSQSIRPAPELTEENFPKLSAGRGRGLAGSFDKMRIKK
ncbi:protein maelstrom homolog [Galleria mellonella]|uniref:Protein maelstrom homolog n=1 Tax=Galleria mellonella TaxID=7137 RepID=A0ABM3MBV7_GALME|nr:protein maelstrom homolog [Galleria mellonella]